MTGIRITVLKRLDMPDLAAEYAPTGSWGKCWLEEGQVFEISGGGSEYPKPDGFCSWAWADIQRDITLLRFGADAPWIRHPGVMISSCTDGRKPVVFKLERIGEPESPPRESQGAFPDTRITVVKRLVNPGIIREYAVNGDTMERQAPCAQMKEGQVFISRGMTKPEGFCSWAWSDIQRDVVWVVLGGVQPGYKHPGISLTCCTDGLNPVVFRVERIEPSNEEADA